MVILCFVVDVSLLSSAALKAVKNCLLQFGNLCALQAPGRRGHTIPRNDIGLCYIAIGELSGTYELTVVLRPNGIFDLRQFHHSVRTMPSSLTEKVKPDGFKFSKQVSSLSTLLKGEDGLLAWTSQDLVKKVVVISSRFLESVTSFRQSLLEAADHYVTVEFIEVEQPGHPHEKVLTVNPDDQVGEPELETVHEFATHVSEFENCTLHRVPFDPWSLMRLLKLWHQYIVFGSEGPIEVVLLFPVPLSAATNKLFCSFQPAIMQLADVFRPCKTCKCHGQPIQSPLNVLPNLKESGRAAICRVTGQKLGLDALTDNGVMVGSGPVLSMQSSETPVVPATGTLGQRNSIAFDVIKCVPLDTLSEGLLFGIPYIVSPSSEIDHDVQADMDNMLQVNEQVFSALLQDLYARDCGLLCTSTRNIDSGEDTAFLCFYILLPAQNGSFSARRLAGAEEMVVTPESATALDDLEVCHQIKSAVSAGLSKLGTETYNPLRNLRGCHLKLSCLVKENLQPPRPDQTQRTAATRPLSPGLTKLEEELFISDFGFDSGGRSLQKSKPPPSFITSATPTTTTPAAEGSLHRTIAPAPLTGKRAGKGFAQVQKSNASRKVAPWASKGRGKKSQGLSYPLLSKQLFTNQQDPYFFSSEPGPDTELPLLPSKRFPNFKTARQHLLDTAAKQLGSPQLL